MLPLLVIEGYCTLWGADLKIIDSTGEVEALSHNPKPGEKKIQGWGQLAPDSDGLPRQRGKLYSK